MDHKKRFMGWRKRMPEKTRYLVDRVLERVVPEFEKQGFVWYPDFARNNPQEIGANEIPLQRREGASWPTVQIKFVPSAPNFHIIFSALPEICRSPINNNIPRSEAIVVYGPAYFYLCESRRKRSFGFSLGLGRIIRYWINWRNFLDSEVDAVVSLLPYLIDIFDKELYRDWMDHQFGCVNDHVFLMMSWKIRDDLERARLSKPT